MSAYSIQPDIKHVRKSGYQVIFFFLHDNLFCFLNTTVDFPPVTSAS